MTKTQKAEKLITDMRAQRVVISWIDDIGPAFRRKGITEKFAIWNMVKRGELIRLGHGAYRFGF